MNILMKDLFYIYKNNGESIVALRGLNLAASTGECLVIKGPNGSGKSTLVKLLTGYFVPTAGQIIVDGEDIAKLDPIKLRREVISSLDQRGNLIKELTVLENLELAYSLSESTAVEYRSHAVGVLEEHSLTQLANKLPAELSASERQYVSLLAALATKPKVLIADEPTGELDDKSASVIYKLLKSIIENTIVILVTHDSRADGYASRMVRIREGRISEEWAPGEPEQSVLDEFGWMRVKEIAHEPPQRAVDRSRDDRVILEVENLGLSYGAKQIFESLNFVAHAGQLIVLDSTLSPGSGKSSLLRILAGLQSPTIGEVRIAGEVANNLDRAAMAVLRSEHLSYLGQREGALEHLSLAEYLGETEVDLGSALNQRSRSPLSSFSGGERARIELTKIIAEARPLLLLDEPTSQMDDRRTLESIALLYKYLEQGGCVVMSTRNEHLLGASDQIIQLTRGM